MKKLFILSTAIFFLFSGLTLSFGQTVLCFESFGQQEIVDKNSFLSMKDSLLGFSLGWNSVDTGDIHTEFRLGYHRLKADQIGFGLKTISDFSFHCGARFYPSFLTFDLGNIPVRFTFSALGGIHWLTPGEWNDVFTFSALLSGGLSISTPDSRYGLIFEFVYLPLSRDIKLKQIDNSIHGTLMLEPSWYIRIGCAFGGASTQKQREVKKKANDKYIAYEFYSDPPGAHIYGADGSYWGQTEENTPVRRILGPGGDDSNYTVKLMKRGYQTVYHSWVIRYKYLSEWEATSNYEKIVILLDPGE